MEKILARLAANDQQLTVVSLKNGNFGDEGAKQVTEALKGNTFLTSLDVSNNNISGEGARLILNRLLEEDIDLVKCSFYNNRLDATSAKQLAALITSKPLTSLDVRNNRGIDVDTAKLLLEALKGSNTMLKLDLRRTGIPEDHPVLLEIEEELKSSKGAIAFIDAPSIPFEFAASARVHKVHLRGKNAQGEPATSWKCSKDIVLVGEDTEIAVSHVSVRKGQMDLGFVCTVAGYYTFLFPDELTVQGDAVVVCIVADTTSGTFELVDPLPATITAGSTLELAYNAKDAFGNPIQQCKAWLEPKVSSEQVTLHSGNAHLYCEQARPVTLWASMGDTALQVGSMVILPGPALEDSISWMTKHTATSVQAGKSAEWTLESIYFDAFGNPCPTKAPTEGSFSVFPQVAEEAPLEIAWEGARVSITFHPIQACKQVQLRWNKDTLLTCDVEPGEPQGQSQISVIHGLSTKVYAGEDCSAMVHAFQRDAFQNEIPWTTPIECVVHPPAAVSFREPLPSVHATTTPGLWRIDLQLFQARSCEVRVRCLPTEEFITIEKIQVHSKEDASTQFWKVLRKFPRSARIGTPITAILRAEHKDALGNPIKLSPAELEATPCSVKPPDSGVVRIRAVKEDQCVELCLEPSVARPMEVEIGRYKIGPLAILPGPPQTVLVVCKKKMVMSGTSVTLGIKFVDRISNMSAVDEHDVQRAVQEIQCYPKDARAGQGTVVAVRLSPFPGIHAEVDVVLWCKGSYEIQCPLPLMDVRCTVLLPCQVSSGRALALSTYVMGSGCVRGAVSVPSECWILPMDEYGNDGAIVERHGGGLRVRWLEQGTGDRNAFPVKLIPSANGNLMARWTPCVPGRHLLCVELNGSNVHGSPFVVDVARAPEADAIDFLARFGLAHHVPLLTGVGLTMDTLSRLTHEELLRLGVVDLAERSFLMEHCCRKHDEDTVQGVVYRRIAPWLPSDASTGVWEAPDHSIVAIQQAASAQVVKIVRESKQPCLLAVEDNKMVLEPMTRTLDRLPTSQRKNVLQHIGTFLKSLHHQSIVHGKVKPTNVGQFANGAWGLCAPCGTGTVYDDEQDFVRLCCIVLELDTVTKGKVDLEHVVDDLFLEKPKKRGIDRKKQDWKREEPKKREDWKKKEEPKKREDWKREEPKKRDWKKKEEPKKRDWKKKEEPKKQDWKKKEEPKKQQKPTEPTQKHISQPKKRHHRKKG